MRLDDERKIRAYLLRRLPEHEQHAFESRLLEEPDLLGATRATEEAFLLGDNPDGRAARGVCAKCFALGAIAGAALLELTGWLIR